LALFALALQLVLSFGHLHLADIAIPQAAAGVLAQAATPDSSAPPDRGARDICAICATLNLTASSFLPSVSALVLPLAIVEAWLTPIEATRISSDPHFLFQARAPPVLS